MPNIQQQITAIIKTKLDKICLMYLFSFLRYPSICNYNVKNGQFLMKILYLLFALTNVALITLPHQLYQQKLPQES